MYSYTFEVRNVFEKMSKDAQMIQMIKDNNYFELHTATHHATASFCIKSIKESDYINTLCSPHYSKKRLLEMCPNNLLSNFN